MMERLVNVSLRAPGFYNEKRGTLNGWNFALEGEPDLVLDHSIPAEIDNTFTADEHEYTNFIRCNYS